MNLESIIEQIASQWDGCLFDVPAEGHVDIGAAIRTAAKRLVHQRGWRELALSELADDEGATRYWFWSPTLRVAELGHYRWRQGHDAHRLVIDGHGDFNALDGTWTHSMPFVRPRAPGDAVSGVAPHPRPAAADAAGWKRLQALRGWSARQREIARAEAADDVSYGNETVVALPGNLELRAPAPPEACGFVRIVDTAVEGGAQLGYWSSDQWQLAPAKVMGLIFATIRQFQPREAAATAWDVVQQLGQFPDDFFPQPRHDRPPQTRHDQEEDASPPVHQPRP